MRMTVLPIAVVFALAAGCAGAQAQPPASGQQQGGHQQMTPEQRFLEMDTNKDNKVTKQEFLSPAELRWVRTLERADTNKDGMLSREEFLAAPKAPQGGQQPQQPR